MLGSDSGFPPGARATHKARSVGELHTGELRAREPAPATCPGGSAHPHPPFPESCRPSWLPETTWSSSHAKENNKGVEMERRGEWRLGKPFP